MAHEDADVRALATRRHQMALRRHFERHDAQALDWEARIAAAVPVRKCRPISLSPALSAGRDTGDPKSRRHNTVRRDRSRRCARRPLDSGHHGRRNRDARHGSHANDRGEQAGDSGPRHTKRLLHDAHQVHLAQRPPHHRHHPRQGRASTDDHDQVFPGDELWPRGQQIPGTQRRLVLAERALGL